MANMLFVVKNTASSQRHDCTERENVLSPNPYIKRHLESAKITNYCLPEAVGGRETGKNLEKYTENTNITQ